MSVSFTFADGTLHNSKMIKAITLLLTLAFTMICTAQTTRQESAHDSIDILDKIHNRHPASLPQAPDPADIARLRTKHLWRATAETAGMNIGLWAFDRYVQKGHYAYISWNTIKENFRHGFEWDNDHLGTNMFAHPYNGSIFFNAGRSNGYNFWASELFAIGGSAMWEMFMECEYPSTNDIIATPIGGAAIGEVLYRTSDLILNDRTTGEERFGRELAAFVVNPMRGVTRLITGDMWRHRSTSGRMFGIPPIYVEIGLGGRILAFHDDQSASTSGGTAEVYIEYGDRYAHTCKAPYDYFSFYLQLNAIKKQPLLSRVEIIGRLLSCEVVDKSKLKVSAGLYQHFDYFDSDTIVRHEMSVDPLRPCAVPYKLGTPASVGGGLMFQSTPTPGIRLDGVLHANGVLLAGILTDFYRDYNRDYNWGSGFSIKAGLNLRLPKTRWAFSIANQVYRLYTWQGYDRNADWSLTPSGKPVNVQGDSSKATFNHFEAVVRYRLFNHLHVSAGVDFYRRFTHYDDIDAYIPEIQCHVHGLGIKSNQVSVHLMFTYKI